MYITQLLRIIFEPLFEFFVFIFSLWGSRVPY